MKSQEVIQQKSKKEKEKFTYSAEEKEQQKIWFERMDASWEAMNTALDEFDGLTWIQTVQSCRLARNAFLTPINNDGEVRVVTGTTEGKVDSIFNAVYNQNMEVDIEAYNEHDIEDVLLGDTMTKVVRRTGEQENEEDIEATILDELLTQPAVYIQENNTDEWYYDRILEEGEWADLWQFKIPKFTKQGWYRKRQPRKVVWTADQVLLADLRIPARLFQTQPYVITYRTLSYEAAERIYRHSPRWKYVHPGMPVKQEMRGNVETSDWRFSRSLRNNEIEEIICKSVCDDVQQIYLSGVPLLPVGCPYLGNRFGTYDMTMEIPKEIHPKFAGGRSVVMQAKTLQALKDEDFRLMILERRQQIWQPIVTKAQAILSKDMWLPAAITYGVNKSDIETLVERGRGVDTSMNEMITKEIEAFINVSSLFQGLETGGDITAFQAAQQMKQALIMLGHALTARMRAKRNYTYLRLYNILQNMLDPIDTRYNDYLEKSEEIYRTYSLAETDLHDGVVGTEIISFLNRKLLPQEEDMVIEMEKESRQNGNPKSYTFVPIQKLKAAHMFKVTVRASEKRNSLIEKEMFKKDITDSISLGSAVGIPINPEYVTQEWGKRVKIDPKKLYVIPNVPQLGPGGVIPQPMDNNVPGSRPGAKQMMTANTMTTGQ